MWQKYKRHFQKLNQVALVFIILCLISFYSSIPAKADLSACSISLDTQTIEAGSDNFFTFTLTDASNNPIEWLDITSPSGNYFNLESATADSWNSQVNNSDVTFTGGSLDYNTSQNFVVEALAGNSSTTSPIYWQVQASDDPGGADPIVCSGDTSENITPLPPSQINILDISVTDITDNSATIDWDTDIPSTSYVYYGVDSNYGAQASSNSNLVTSHSVVISGLSTNQGYHFEVASTTPDGGVVQSGDNTFMTNDKSSQQPSGKQGSGVTNINNEEILGGGIPIVEGLGDKIPPTISLNSIDGNLFKTIPTFSGQASDNLSVARVQYSTDGGVNWLPADQASGLGSPHATFSFTPIGLDDGTYNILARAIDTSGNIGLSKSMRIVIARLDPIIGGDIFSLGPQILPLNSNGTITTLAGVDQKVTLSAVGGPTSITLIATSKNNKKSQEFNLTKSADTGLWSGIVSFSQPGVYQLIGSSVNGVGYHMTRILNTFDVLEASHTFNQKTHKAVESKVTVYYYDTESQQWLVWDGSAYGQKNPQTTGKEGGFKLYMPAGKYYLQATASGYQTTTSNIFELKQTTPITINLEMNTLHQLRLGPLHFSLPTFSTENVDVTGNTTTSSRIQTYSLIGKELPTFNLPTTNGGTISSVSLLGKPTLITIGATWSPTTQDQMAILGKLQTNKYINIVPIALQESSSKVQAYMAMTGLNLNWAVDSDSISTQNFDTQYLPTHYFVNRQGIVVKVVVGTLSSQQIINMLESL